MHRRSFVPVYDPEYYDSNEEFTSHNFTYSDYLMPKRREKRGVSPVFLVNDDFEPTYAIEYYDDIELLDMTKDDYMVPKHDLKRTELGLRMSTMKTTKCPVCQCDFKAKENPVTENRLVSQPSAYFSFSDARWCISYFRLKTRSANLQKISMNEIFTNVTNTSLTVLLQTLL